MHDTCEIHNSGSDLKVKNPLTSPDLFRAVLLAASSGSVLLFLCNYLSNWSLERSWSGSSMMDLRACIASTVTFRVPTTSVLSCTSTTTHTAKWARHNHVCVKIYIHTYTYIHDTYIYDRYNTYIYMNIHSTVQKF